MNLNTDLYLFKIKVREFLMFVILVIGTTSCYTYKWTDHSKENQIEVSENVKSFFKNNKLVIEGISPSSSYKYDAWEKDATFGKKGKVLKFTSVTFVLKDKSAKNQVLVDATFADNIGNKVKFNDFDLMRIVPKLNTKGNHLYPELLLEEFNRFGVGFRKEFNEFEIEKSKKISKEVNTAIDRVYRASITNGCLSSGKWEMALTSEDYSDFSSRVKNGVNYNQNKIFAHSWFLFPKGLYKELIQLKNPDVNIENFDLTNFDYKKLSNFSKKIKINFNELRKPIKKKWNIEVVEIGHKSKSPIELLDMEEHYKINYGLFIGYDQKKLNNETYASIVSPEKQPLSFAQFRDEGFYSPKNALKMDMNWLSHLDDITVKSVDLPDTDCVVEIELKGKWCPYKVTIGNFDLSTVQEQKLYGLHFGFNTYPKGRRYNPAQPTITFDEDLMPKEYERYVLLTDAKTGNWVDNFHKGLGKVYLSFDTLEKDVLSIYLVSYERIVPLWKGKIKLPKELRERARIRKQLYSY